MKHSKKHYKELIVIPGYKWAFFDKGLHSFIKRVPNGYLEVRVNENDINTGSHIQMMERNLTR